MTGREIPELLDELGFSRGSTVEAIVTTRRADGSPNAAPMGIARVGPDLLQLRPFRSSETYRNLMRNPEACVNVTSDPELFLATALKQEMELGPMQPAINRDLSLDAADAAVFIEALSGNAASEDRGRFVCRANSITVRRHLPMVFSRGRAEAVEAVIHGTRIRAFLSMGRSAEAENLIKRIGECREVIRRVSSPDAAEAKVIEALEASIERWRGSHRGNRQDAL